MREQSLFQAGHEHGVELEPLRGVNGHELQGRPAFRGLRLARFERGMGKKRGERVLRDFLAFRRDHGVGFPHESGGGIDQLVQVVDPILAVALRLVMRTQTALLQDLRHHLRQLEARRSASQGLHQPDEGRYARA